MLKPRRAPGADTGPDFDTRELVRGRFGNRCARCGGYGGGNVHHRRPRGRGGNQRQDDGDDTNCPTNLLWLCGSGTTGCHGWAESNRSVSYDEGWLVPHGITPPVDVPVRLWDGRLVYLNPDGGWDYAATRTE